MTCPNPPSSLSRLLAHARWSSATHVRVVSSPMGIGPGVSSFTYVDSVVAHAEQVRQAIQSTHDRVASDLRQAGLTVDARILPGMPAEAILAEADRLGAGLIMVGAHRQSPLTATLLGSVSKAVVERAGCAVLVVRSATAGRVLLATDGSMLARLATTIVATSPLFASSTVRVVGVSSPPPRSSGVVLREDARSEAYRTRTAASADDAAAWLSRKRSPRLPRGTPGRERAADGRRSQPAGRGGARLARGHGRPRIGHDVDREAPAPRQCGSPRAR